MSEIRCSVETLEAFNDSVYHVVLRPEQSFSFAAGQYLMVKMSEDDKRPFSIASAPSDGELIELHIGASEVHSYPMQVIERMKQDGEITILAPHGEAQLSHDNELPVVLVAGGTGFSYVRSIVRELVATQDMREISVYWGCKDAEHIYLLEEMEKLAEAQPNIQFIPVVENPNSEWLGVTGQVHQAVLADYADLSGYEVYAAGRFEMVGVIRDAFLAQGMKIERMHGDALPYLK
ncbi:NAD(P)H-flavin reductase [Psychrobium sp. 1_MG-2023]|uniref:NAD(P)H-flavin reductase n=1 Tax=Psychrobium sp. 1_MG-2023 TaxID=3062624 RepID=UPI000C328C54|nr:NAD(P)H-flavin reductase [Psychrobium sp. 1_MG-2023]MDP2559569.1 NAD(P)H-flavin reductase [Psychrobium sp. 1_MG-2023]PKF59408.1 NAD(P)H-flavin reductase [Alteromonadales bacterium alter-6D02]